MGSRPLAVDWDGTLVSDGEWVEGAREFLKFWRRQGVKVIVHSSRANYEQGRMQIRAMLDAARFGDVEIVAKPDAFAYVDNLAVAFGGSWVDARERVRLLRKDS